MSEIVNERDLILQATSPRVIPIKVPIEDVDGLEDALANAGRRIDITASSSTFAGVDNPTTITLTADLKGGLAGEVVWSVVTGSLTLTPSGTSCTISNMSMLTSSAVIRARVTVDGIDYDATYTLSKLGSLAAQDYVNLQTQVAGKLNSGNVDGLGALALLNTVNLNTQTTGALDANTQVNNLGALAFANAIAANQIGAGQLAAGVVYAGQIVATQIKSGSFAGEIFTGGTFSGSDIQTNTGTIGGVKINENGLNAGAYTNYGWPPGTGTGFHLGPNGLLLGNANNGRYIEIQSSGNIYAPGLQIENGNAAFSGNLSGASGTFSGTLTAERVVTTGNLELNSVTIPLYAQSAAAYTFGNSALDLSIPAFDGSMTCVIDFGCTWDTIDEGAGVIQLYVDGGSAISLVPNSGTPDPASPEAGTFNFSYAISGNGNGRLLQLVPSVGIRARNRYIKATIFKR